MNSEYLNHVKVQNDLSNHAENLSPGDKIYILKEYNIYSGKVIKVNPKGIKVDIPAQKGMIAYQQSMPYEKVLKAGTPAALIWEQWKGSNGRGGYRFETIMYPETLIPVEKIPHQRYLYEKDFGNAKQEDIQNYLKDISNSC